MKILTNGHFSFTVGREELAKGLRNTNKVPRDKFTLESLSGMVGVDGELSSIPPISLSDVMANALVIKDDFPFPQLFILDNQILICNRSSILELVGETLTLKISIVNPSQELWSADSSCGFIYLSNGEYSIVRDPNTGTYSLSTAPVCSAICNFNGQIICGNIR